MSATWMLGTTIVGLLCWLAAATLSRVAALYRGTALRWIWVGATALSLGVALSWLLAPAERGLESASHTRSSAMIGTSDSTAPAPASAPNSARASDAFSWDLSLRPPTVSSRADHFALALWLLASVTMLGLLLVTGQRLRRERGTWTPTTIGDATVLVSDRFGPAVLGVRRTSIILPAWVLSLDERAQRVIVRHEVEHCAAHDPTLLLAASAALVVLPWNVGLWMLWRGLRRAIEIDCDARVVRSGVDGAEYASVLLSAWRRSRQDWSSAIAFAERASGLGTRIEQLMRPAPRGRVVKSIAGALLAMLLIVVACTTQAPRAQGSLRDAYPLTIIDGVARPELPPQSLFVGAVAADTVSSPRFEVRYSGPMVANSAARSLYPAPGEVAEIQEIPAPAAEAQFGREARYGARLIYTRKYRERGGRLLRPELGVRYERRAEPGTPPEHMVGVVYARMFRGIHLDTAREEHAREVIRVELKEQGALRGPVLAIWPRRIALADARSVALRALVSGADLATLQKNLEEYVYHEISREEVERSQYASLLSGVTLDADDAARARRRIATFVRDELAAYERSPDATAELLALRTALENDLRALVRSDAEGSLYDRRIAAMRAHR